MAYGYMFIDNGILQIDYVHNIPELKFRHFKALEYGDQV